MAVHINRKSNSAWPSEKTLAEETALSDRAVLDHLKRAEDEGWIKRAKRGNGKGWRLTVYTPAFPPCVGERSAPPTTPSAGERLAAPSHDGGERHVDGGEPGDVMVVSDVRTNSSKQKRNAVLPEERSPTQNTERPSWISNPTLVEKRGAILGIKRRPRETLDALAERVLAAVSNRGTTEAAA